MGSPTLSLAKPDALCRRPRVRLSLDSFHQEVHTGIRTLALRPILGFPFPGFTPQPHSMLSSSDAVFPELAVAEGERGLRPCREESGAQTPALESLPCPCCFHEAKRLSQFPRITRQPLSCPFVPSPRSGMGSSSLISNDGRAGRAAPWSCTFVPEKKAGPGHCCCHVSFHFAGVRTKSASFSLGPGTGPFDYSLGQPRAEAPSANCD